MIASLPMYARPDLADAHHRYWELIRQQLGAVGIDSPVELSQDRDEQRAWTDPSLVLSQTCGMPYRRSLHGSVTLIGTPDYQLDECDPGYYRSAMVVRRDDQRASMADFERATFAYNHTESQSGYAAPYHHMENHGFWFAAQLHSGQHLASAQAVAAGAADIASLDAVSWRLMQRNDDFATTLRVLEWTEPTPGLPYISARTADGPKMFTAIAAAIAQLSHHHRTQLGIAGLVNIPAARYLEVPNP